MTTYLPIDSDRNPIPVLRLNSDKAHQISSADVSARNATPFDEITCY